MTETLREYVNSHATPLRIDGRRGVIRGVKILGVRSKNGRRYEKDALRNAASLYENAKVNVNHARGENERPRDYQDRIGVVRNVQFQEEGLFADFHFNPKHALAEQLLWDAEHASENVGFSHNVRAKVARSGDETIVKSIVSVQSVDLVADPATTQGLFEEVDDQDGTSAGVETESVDSTILEAGTETFWESLTLETLRERRGDLVQTIRSETDAEWNRRLDEETASLRETVRAMEQREEETRRLDTVVRLLREHGLETPSGSDSKNEATQGKSVGTRFFEMLTSLKDEQRMRELIEEHAATLRGGRSSSTESHSKNARPVCREQNVGIGSSDVSPLKAFMRSVVR